MKRIMSLLAKTKVLLTPDFWQRVLRGIIHLPPKAYRTSIHFGCFFILLFAFLITKINHLFSKIPFIGKFFVALGGFWHKSLGRVMEGFLAKIEHFDKSTVKRSYLIELGYKNLLVKKTRTFITILGMSVGVGVIVLLLSLGYGIERLIINQVASLDDLKMVDVTIGQNTALRLNETVLRKVMKLPKVSSVMPVVSFVGRITYNDAKSDVLVYSASNRFMESSHLKLSKGKLFDNNNAYVMQGKSVAGAEDVAQSGTLGKTIDSNGEISMITILPDHPAHVFADCLTTSKVLGVTPRVEGDTQATAVWGDNYDHYFEYTPQVYDSANQMFLATWYKGSFPLYYEAQQGQYQPVLDDHGQPEWADGCVEAKDVQLLDKRSFGEVLGAATSSASLDASDSAQTTDTSTDTTASDSGDLSSLDTGVVATDSSGLEIVSLATTSGSLTQDTKITLTSGTSRQAVVSKALLALFNIPLNNAVGKEFQVSFILTKSLIPTIDGKATTDDLTYKIIGVIDDDNTPYFYVPLSDISKMKVDNFSQLKIVMADQGSLAVVRKSIETLGFRTTSTADTISQIQSLFNNIRLILGLLGLVALAVASLGMFNTLTVSLLERTREIGGLKTMGMISQEVQDLFLSEAMIMGLAGGFGGLFLGFIVGQFLSFIVSLIAFTNGQGYLNLTYIPPFLSLFIIISSFVVGLFTGLYPSRRARKISALNALRYE